MRRHKDDVLVTLTVKQYRILRDSLLWWRNELIEKNLPTIDLDEILIKIMK